MKISARNILKGTVVAVAEGAVNGVVSIKIGDDVVKADITMEAIKSLGLAEGVEAFAIVKASSVMFAAGSEKIVGISARNQIAGTVVEVTEGPSTGMSSSRPPRARASKGPSRTRPSRRSVLRRALPPSPL